MAYPLLGIKRASAYTGEYVATVEMIEVFKKRIRERKPMKPKTGKGAIPMPPDAPLMNLGEAGAYLRLSAASVRKLIDGRAEARDDSLGKLLRGWVVRLSPHRRYIRREPFFEWLRKLAG